MQGRIGKTTLKVTIYDTHLDGAKNLETAEDKIKCQLTKYQLCMGCKACESICKHNAIVIRDERMEAFPIIFWMKNVSAVESVSTIM